MEYVDCNKGCDTEELGKKTGAKAPLLNGYGAEDCGIRTPGWVNQRLENSLSNQRRIRQQKERNRFCLSDAVLTILKVGAGFNPHYLSAMGKLLPFMTNKMMGLTFPRLVVFAFLVLA